MAVDALVTTYTGDGGTGAKSITVTGVTPKLAIAWGNSVTSTNQADSLAFIGAATSSSERGAVLFGSSDAVANERAGAQVVTDQMYREASAPAAAAFTTVAEYDLSSFAADTININVTDAFTTRHNILALGGADFEAEVVNFTLDSGNATKTVSLARLTSSQVKAVIVMFMRPRTSAGTSTGAGAAGLCIGMTDGTNQGCFTTQLEDLADPTDNRSATYNNKLYTILDDAGAVTDQGTISSLGTGQFVISQDTRANNYICIAIAICGTCQVAVGAYDQPSSATTQALGFSFTPKALLALSGSTLANTVTDDARFSIGAASSTSAEAAIAGFADDAAATTSARQATVTNKLIRHGILASALAEAGLSDMNTLDWTTADATARTTIILAIGDAAAGGVQTVSQTDGLYMPDYSTRQTQKINAEGTFLLDTALPSAIRTLLASDGLFLADTYSKVVSRLLVDGLFLDEASIRQTQRTLLDTLLFYEESTQAKGKFVTAVDGLLLADTVSKVVQLRLNDTLFLFDSVSTSAAQLYLITATDTLLLLDTTTKILEATRPDSVLLADLATKQIQRLVDDALFLLDIRTASTSLMARETVLLSDTLGTSAERYRSFEDQILLHDQHSKIVQKVTQDGLLLLDEVRKIRHLLHADHLFLLDSATTSLVQAVTQALVYARLATRSFLGIRTEVSAWPNVQPNVADFLNVEVGVVDPNNLT